MLVRQMARMDKLASGLDETHNAEDPKCQLAQYEDPQRPEIRISGLPEFLVSTTLFGLLVSTIGCVGNLQLM